MAGSVLKSNRMLALRAIVVAFALCASSTSALATEASDRAGATPPATNPRLDGFAMPVDGVLDLEPELLPGAERAYRAGVHEGIDFAVPYGTPVRAARPGIVMRVDRDYVEWPAAKRDAALLEAVRLGKTPEATLDRLRGRQVWIDHGDGVVTRYAHLASVANLGIGEPVWTGTVIGTVGSSGLPEGGPHLHFEIRIGERYLGEGLTRDEVRELVVEAFAVERPTARPR
jgi:murein DD-endopeptidase MepM/ murein hydrolase activator NlpD